LAATEGLERLDVTAKDSAGATSQAFTHGFMVQPNRNPALPQTLIRKQSNNEPVYVSPTDAVSISGFALIDDDQDAVSWTSQGGDFVTKGGTVTFNASGTVLISATNLKASDYGNYTAKIRSTETSAGHAVATNDYCISSTVGDRSDSKLGGSESEPYGQITSFPNNLDEAVKGIPFVFQFNAADVNNSNNRAIDWWLSDGREISDLGSKAKDVLTKPNYSFISVNGEKPLVGELGASFERWRNRGNNDKSYNPHEMIFVPTNDDTYVVGSPSARVSFGVAAQFSEPPTVAFQNFYINVKDNSAPTIPYSTGYTGGIATTVANSDKWDGVYPAEPRLVFKGKTEGSFDLSSVITFTRDISDDDLPAGEVFKIDLKYVTVGTNTAPASTYVSGTTSNLGKAGYDVTANVLPYLSAETKSALSVDYAIRSAKTAKIDGTIKFDKMPVSGELTTTAKRANWPTGTTESNFVKVADLGLIFTYEVTDLGDNKVQFHVYVPTRDNNEPVIDDFNTTSLIPWEASSGDTTKKFGGWADKRPTEEITTQWTLDWTSDGDTPGTFQVADPFVDSQDDPDPVYMEVAKQPWEFRNGVYEDNNVTVSPAGELNYYSLPWTFSWLPIESDARKKYAFTIKAWDRYGAAAEPYDMEGVVFGTIYGTSVVKSIYSFNYNGSTKTAGVVSKPADFTSNGWASINLTEFVLEDNQYASEKNEVHAYSAGGRRTEGEEVMHAKDRWKVYSIPPGPYMVSADHLDGGGRPVATPVIGPAVTSTDLVGFGATVDAEPLPYRNMGGNVFPYAYIDSSTPNLSTNVGSGRLALSYDWSLSEANYGFGLEWAAISPNMGYDADGKKVPVAAAEDVLFQLGNDTGIFTGLTYTGRMAGIGAGSLVANADAIQFTFPSVGQTAFFDVGSWAPLAGAYPVGAYDPQLGWNSKLGYASANPVLADNDISFRPITFDMAPSATDANHILPFATAANDLLTLSTVVKGLSSAKLGISSIAGLTPVPAPGTAQPTSADISNYPYWKMSSTGIVQPREQYMEMSGLDAAGAASHILAAQTSNWAPVGTQGNFTASVNRTAFKNVIKLVRPSVPGDDFSDVKDTLRVVAYVNGTELGPVENAHGVPVYLEFGNLNANTASAFSDMNALTFLNSGPLAPGLDKFNSAFMNGTINLGTYQIPMPDLDRWDAVGTTPVVSYIVKYAAESGTDTPGAGLSGTMGTIKVADGSTAAITVGQNPITNLRITTTQGYDGNARNNVAHVDVSDPLTTTSTTSATNGVSYAHPALASARAYRLTSGVPGKVWLSWTNPAGNFSGNILEFFQVQTGANNLTDASVPLRKVYLAPTVNRFPIPDTWLLGTGVGSLGRTGYDVVIRVRTVKYGSGNFGSLFAGNAPGTYMINFNEEPFMQALPASWVDTISGRINFENVIDGTDGIFEYNPGANLKWASNVPIVWAAPLPVASAVVDSTSDVAQAVTITNLLTWTAAGTTIDNTNTNITHTWYAASTNSVSGDLTQLTVVGSRTSHPTVAGLDTAGFVGGETITFNCVVSYNDGGNIVPAVTEYTITITLT
jgi:hypothetical protein